MHNRLIIQLTNRINKTTKGLFVMKKKDIKVTLFAVVCAIVLAVSSAFLISTVKASAASIPASTKKINTFAKAYTYSVKGVYKKSSDWSCKNESKSVKVTCKYNAKTRMYNFKFTSKSYGLDRITLKYKTGAKTFKTVKLSVFSDPQGYVMRTA